MYAYKAGFKINAWITNQFSANNAQFSTLSKEISSKSADIESNPSRFLSKIESMIWYTLDMIMFNALL